MPLEPEELIGKLWHRLITRAAEQEHAAATITLEEMRLPVGVMFRALGGDGGLRAEAAGATEHGARRGWLQRIAGSGREAELAWRDGETLRLPARIALFTERALNRDLYLWLAALAALDDTPAAAPRPWLQHNQHLTRQVLERFAGLQDRYQRLVAAHLAQRPDPAALPAGEAAAERAIRAALREPGSVPTLPPASQPPHPVPLWLHPSPPLLQAAAPPSDGGDNERGSADDHSEQERQRRRAERVDAPEKTGGLLALRMENLFSWGEFMPVKREVEEDDTNAEQAARDLDVLSVTRDNRPTASRLRFDLDLPAAEYDDLPLGDGLRLPEWDYRKALLRPDHCRLLPMLARDATPMELPPHLRRSARRVRGQFEALVQSRTWYRGQVDGNEVDLAAYLDFVSDRTTGHASPEQGLYRDFRSGNRDLACLLLADLSLSTDAAVNNEARVIDVIRDSLFLFAEALAAAGDRFAMYGFSSRKREHVRFHLIKPFGERYNAATRGRIQAIRPGYYTRMGAAIRHATSLLAAEPASRQLLLILTDGKPNDLDHYEGRYGVEDTRHALHQARQRGLHPFCVTIDRQAGDYLPHLFGPGNYVVIRRPDELPRRLPLLYAHLTA